MAEAYDVIGDTAKRKEYDDMRAMFAGAGAGGFGGGYPGGFGQPGGAGGFDISDLFGDFNRGEGGGFGTRTVRRGLPAGRRGGRDDHCLRRRDQRHHDQPSAGLRCAVRDVLGHRQEAGHPTARLSDVREGAGAVSSVGRRCSMNETCPECHGRQLVYDEACPTCHGSGRGLSSRTVSARIPAGVKDGQRIRPRASAASGGGGPAGDLLVTVHVRPHRIFGARTTSPSRHRSPSTRPRSVPRSRCRRSMVRR